jgi:riboflavin synthase
LFSGIVEKTVPVTRILQKKGNWKIYLDLGPLVKQLNLGHSVAVNGTCLTVVGKKGKIASFEVIQETLKRTNLGLLKVDDIVNVERSLLLGSRLEGHLVQGHIDGTGKIIALEKVPGSTKIWVKTSNNLARMMINKGSVALDGISLTIVDVQRNSFSVCLIPHTLMTTTLMSAAIGMIVNIEVDIIGKWIERLVRDAVGDGGHSKSLKQLAFQAKTY